MSNQNQQTTNITSVGEARKTLVACQKCTQINVEINSGHDENTISATQNQSFMGQSAKRFKGEATSSTKQNPTAIEDATVEFKKKLQQFYKAVTLPRVAWLDKGEDLAMSNYYTEIKLDITKIQITIEEIFQNIDEKEPRRILIEGQPGYGKTTLATKLIYDWALSENYIKHFELAFFISLRELEKKTIDDTLIQIAKYAEFEDTILVQNIIQKNISNVLLILDGFDELQETDRMSILDLLYEKQYSQMTIIVTCRTGLFKVEHTELSKLFGGLSRKKTFYDKRAQVLGIGIEKRKEYLLKFIPPEDADRIINQIENLTKSVSDMFTSPLFLILLAFIATYKNDNTDDEIIEESALTSKTNLFKRLFNCIINRSLKSESDNQVDLFAFDSTTYEIQKTIQQFGKSSLDQLLHNKMQFKCDKVTEKIYKMGFLMNKQKMYKFQTITHYEAFHLSILEFAAAFSIWINFKQNPSSTNAFHHIQSIYPQLDETSLVVPFLIGLLQHEACHFFNQFTSYAPLFSSSKFNIWPLLMECPTNSMRNMLLPSIIPFIPTIIDDFDPSLRRMQLPDFFDNLIQVGIENNQIERIIVDITDSSLRLPNNVIIPNLIIRNYPFRVHDQKLINSYQGIQCKNFHLTLHGYDFLNILNLFSLIVAQSYSLVLYDDDNGKLSKLMYKHIDNHVVKQLQLNHLYVVMYNPILKDLIPILLKRNQVQHLHMPRYDNLMELTEYYKIISAATISSYLHSLHLRWEDSDNKLVIDLFDLTQGGMKKYNCLWLENCQIICKKEIQDKNCIHTLIIYKNKEFKLRLSSNGLSAIAPEDLKCNSSVIQQLSPLWMGYTSLKELNLFLEDNIEDWSFLSNCKNLKNLTISFDKHYKYSFDIMNKFIKCVQQLPIEQLGILSDGTHSVWEKLSKQIASSLPWMNKSHRIQTLRLNLFEWNGKDETICSVILDFLECLKLGYLKTIDLSYNQHLNWHSLMSSNIINYSLFRITHSFEDDEYSNFRCKFCINLKE